MRDRFICENHFKDTDYRTAKKFYLKMGAFPKHYTCASSTVFDTDSEENLKVLTPKRSYSEMKRSVPPNSPNCLPKKKIRFEDSKESQFINDLTELPDAPVTPRKLKLKQKIHFQTKKIKNYEKKLYRLRKRVQKSRINIFSIIPFLTFLSTVAKTFVIMQLRGKRRIAWSQTEKEFSVSLYYKSRSAYIFLRRKGIILPAISTIQKWIGQNTFKTGVDDDIKKYLTMKCAGMEKNEKKCLIACDEMSIKEYLEYNKKLDIIEGFEDLGPLGRSTKHATHALVFSIRGLYSSWKFPLAYFFSHHSTNKDNLKYLINYILETLHAIGFLPRALVCDQGSNNRGALTLLGVTKDQPYFHFNGNKIFAFFDVPHLFKSIRNNLLSGTFKLFDKIISFDIIKRTYEIDKSSQTARTLPKITDKHISPNAFEKMSCNLALQIFSNTMAAAIKTCVEIGHLNREVGSDTAEFIEDMNNLFDALNSKRLFTNNPFNCGLSAHSTSVLNIFKKGKDIFNNLVKVAVPLNKQNNLKIPRESRPPCFDGMLQSINAIFGLYEDEKKENNYFLLTNRLNQDFLENFFSMARQRGGWNLNPTARSFRLFFRIKSITNLLTPSKFSNCEEDNDQQFLISGATRTRDLSKDSTIDTNSNKDNKTDFDLISENSDEENIDSAIFNDKSLEDCANNYYAGYLIKRVIDKFNCSKCKNSLKTIGCLTDPHQIFILNKSYGGKEQTSLVVPDKAVEHVVQKSMSIFKKMFDKYKHEECVATKIKNKIILENLNWIGPTNDDCHDHKIFLLTKLIHTNFFKFCKWSRHTSTNFKQKIKNLKNV